MYVAVGLLALTVGLWWVNRPPSSSIQGMWQSDNLVLKLNGDGTGTFDGGGAVLTPKDASYDQEHKTMRLGMFSGAYEEVPGGRKFIFHYGVDNKFMMIFERM